MNSQKNIKSQTLWFALIILIASVIYGFLITAQPLTWGDDSNIFNNPHFLNNEWVTFWKEPYLGLYIPVTNLVWESLYHLGSAEAWPYRILNLLLHLLNSAMVFLLLRGLARRWSFHPVTVMFATALFALHPLQVHAVAWLSGGRDLLSAFFALAATGVYFGRRQQPGGSTSHSRFALATALFLTSMLCKPAIAVLPLIFLGLEAILEGRIGVILALRMGLWTFFAAAVAWLTKMAQGPLADTELSFGNRLLVVLDTYSFYLQKFVTAYPLTANYARTPEAALADGTVMASVFMAFAILAGFGFLSWRTDRRYLLILLWFVALLPVSGLFSFAYQNVSTVSDHYNYLPMALLAALTLFVLSRIEWQKAPRPVPHAILGVLIVALSLLSWNRAQAWTSDAVFFTDMSKTSPDSYSTALGMSIVMCEDEQQFEEGIKWTEIALKAKPLDILALANQAFCFLHAKNYFRVIELEYYLGQLDIDTIEQTQPTAYSSLLASIGTAYIEQQEYDDGFQFLCEAYRVKPTEPNHAANLQIAKDLLKSKGIEPTCEQVTPGEDEDGGAGSEPIQDIWPQFEQGPDGGPGDEPEQD